MASGLAINGRLPRQPTGLLLTGGGLCLLCSASAWWLPGPVATAAAIVGLMVAWPLAVVYYPDGRLLPVVGAAAFCLVLVSGVTALASSGELDLLQGAGLVIALALVVVGWLRYERGVESDRIALLWLAFAVVGTLMVGGHVAFLAPHTWGVAVAVAVCLSVPAAMAVGISTQASRTSDS